MEEPIIFENHVHYFPQADNEAVQHFAIPFLKLMFAHANFERVFGDLQYVVAKKNKNWKAIERAEKIVELMIDRNNGTEAEIATAKRILTDALPLCNTRNLLAHGNWWRFDPKTHEIDVRSDIEREGEEQHTRFSTETLTKIADRFDELEIELWHVKRAIEKRAREDLPLTVNRGAPPPV
jgi:hypothetical protein